MANKRSDKSKYESKYSPDKFVTGTQYIIELICERKAKNINKDLPLQFWKRKEWEHYYKSQVRAVSSLVKKYGETALLKTLRNNNNIYSFRPQWVKQLIIKEYNKTKLKKQTFQNTKVDVINKKDIVAGDTYIKKNSRSKLMELDDE